MVENLSPARIQILDLSIKAVINLLSILTAQIFAEFLFWDPHAGICWNSGLVHQKMLLVPPSYLDMLWAVQTTPGVG